MWTCESADWRMSEYERQEAIREERAIEREERGRNYLYYWNSGELLDFARQTAHEYRIAADGEDYSQESWEEWLKVDSSHDEDLYDAVLYAIEDNDAFTQCSQIDRLAGEWEILSGDSKAAFGMMFPDLAGQLDRLKAVS